jgi:bifunctional non-homologous end joining protein LigD
VPPSQQTGKLAAYRRKRDFAATTEPAGESAPVTAGEPAAGSAGQTVPSSAGETAPGSAGETAPTTDRQRFVIQEHHATRLHWDLRLEHDGVLASWAVPNGIPPDPAENRLAVRTEDHPLEYLEFHGEIPRGQYGAGTMTIWDRGTYELHKWEDKKVEVTFHGERVTGRYGLFPIGRAGDSANDWMIHRMDPPADPDREPMPERIIPMMARPASLAPRGQKNWSFEVKWDGVRAIAYLQPGRLRLESRNLNDITEAYPEVRGLVGAVGMHEMVLDGEIVAFDDAGRPSFERLQRRMHVTSPSAIRRLAGGTPVVYAIFDLLYLDGRSLMDLPYSERRARLEALNLSGPAWRVPVAHPGEGKLLLEATAKQGLEGIVAKRLDSRYEPGRRSGNWLKIKHTLRQELVIGGWIPGEGRRTERIGALLTGYYEKAERSEAGQERPETERSAPPSAPATRPDQDAGPDGPRSNLFRYAGRVGTGFTEKTLDDLHKRLAPLRRDTSPFDQAPKLPRESVFVQPRLVAEIEFRAWTNDGVMRAPSFKGLREDKSPREVVREPDAELRMTEDGDGSGNGDRRGTTGRSTTGRRRSAAGLDPASPEALFDEVERLPDGALAVVTEGRRLKITNWDKVLYPQTGFTKGDLVAFYARVAPVVLPHLHDRPLTLKRYPNGVDQPYFYEKQSPSHRPEWVRTARIGDINYTLAQDRPTLIWLANLADVELHTSLSLAQRPEQPTMMVFDLDPGPPAGVVECCEVGLVLHGLFEQLGLESVAKTSGSKGLQVYVPLDNRTDYDAAKPFAKRVAEVLEERMPELVVSRMTKKLRPGKVLVDWSQNDKHKTTVNVYSLRARERPTVSTPLTWEEVSACHEQRDEQTLTFEADEALRRAHEQGDLFAPVLSAKQSLPSPR